MIARHLQRSVRDRRALFAPLPLGAGLAALLLVFSAAAQDAGAPAPPPANPPAEAVAPQPAPSQPAPAPAFQPGFLDAVGDFFKDSAAQLGSRLKDARESIGTLQGRANDTAQDAAGTAKDAAGVIVGLPTARVVNGRERCELAVNGAPDCRKAAEAVCRGKGFASGKSLDTDAAHECPPQAAREALLTGRTPKCPLETFVTRAVCQ